MTKRITLEGIEYDLVPVVHEKKAKVYGDPSVYLD